MQIKLKELRNGLENLQEVMTGKLRVDWEEMKEMTRNCESIAQKFKESRRNGWKIVSQFNYESLFRNYWIPIWTPLPLKELLILQEILIVLLSNL